MENPRNYGVIFRRLNFSLVFIKKLEMKGFKSYGDKKVTLVFPKGFTAIIGPNGSGKSNILDAFCFVLGNLSAKTMRAGNFADLIYSGGKKTPPAKQARVTLYLDNKDRGIQIDSDTVIISREVCPDGKGTYTLNGKKVSRSQIVDLLSMAGISPDGYNIVLQGQLSQIIQMNPSEVRELIEKVAGISAYNEKKEKAISELNKANENISKIELIMREVENELKALAKEKEDAEKWNSISQEISNLKALLIFEELEELNRKRDDLISRLSERKRTLEKLEKNKKDLLTEINELKSKSSTLEEEIQRKQGGEFSELLNKIGSLKSEVSIFETDVKYLNKSMEEVERRLETYNRELAEVISKITNLRSEEASLRENKSRLESELNKIDRELNELKTELLAIDKNHELYLSKLKELRETLKEKRKILTEVSSEESAVREELKHLKIALDTLLDKIKNAETIIQSIENELNELNENKRSLNNQINELINEHKQLTEKINTTNTKIMETTDSIKKTRERLLKLKVKINAIKEERERFYKKRPAVQEILRLRDKGSVKGIYGTIAELCTVSSEFAKALEVAAGNKLNYIVVENDEVASECINFLKNKKIGRASFLPLNKLKPKVERNLPKINGLVGLALDLIKYDEKFKLAFEYVFGRTLIMDNLDNARKLYNNDFRKVTLDGDVIEPGGLMIGGYYGFLPKIGLEEEEQIPILQNELKTLETSLKSLEENKRELQKELKTLESVLSEKRSSTDYLKVKIENTEARLSEKRKELEDYTKSFDNMKSIIDAKEQLLKQIHNRRNEILAEIKKLEDEEAKLAEITQKAELNRLNTKIRELEEKKSSIKDQIREVDLKIMNITTQLEQNLISREESLKYNIEKLNKSLPELKDNLLAKEEELNKRKKILDELLSKKAKLERNIASLIDEKKITSRKIEEISTKIEDIKREIHSLSLGANRMEINLENITKTISELEEKAKNYSHKFTKDLKHMDPNVIKSKIRELEEIKLSLEPINQKAIEKYETVKARLDELKTMRNKLIKERQSILDFMHTIEREKIRVFNAAFEKINKNFYEIFSKLSPNGEAYIMLENPENPFAGGARIKAKPAGKNVRYLESMSGGEKALTALALIFAIQRYQPAPFYILDEIDAALDVSNVIKVAELIKELSKKSQFIITTLRDVMMARADCLFGVVRGDDYSKIVSVKLEEASSYIE
ncbi:MAG: chromosome segregation protein SMC [Candidatus Odinarchaeia archaeon]